MHVRGLGTRSRRPATGDGRRDVVCGSARPAPAAIGEILASPKHCRSMRRMAKLILLPRPRHHATVHILNKFVNKSSTVKTPRDTRCGRKPRNHAHVASTAAWTTTARRKGNWRGRITVGKRPSVTAVKGPPLPIPHPRLCDSEMWGCRQLHAVDVATALAPPGHHLKDESLALVHDISTIFCPAYTYDETLGERTPLVGKIGAVSTSSITCARSGESGCHSHCFVRLRQLLMPPAEAAYKRIWQAQISAIVLMPVNYACPRAVQFTMRGGTGVC